VVAEPVSTNLEVISKPPVQYTSEARQLKVQGDVVLRVTFTASGQVVVQACCADWATDLMKRRAGWRNRYVFVRPRATAGRWI
jgi:hypothetical protein